MNYHDFDFITTLSQRYQYHHSCSASLKQQVFFFFAGVLLMSSSLLGRRQSQKSSPVINVSFFSFIFEIAAVITAYFLKQCRASPTCISDLKATLGRRGGKKRTRNNNNNRKRECLYVILSG
jgi:hypothetical protein